ncbi:MAG TPA: hypothetical protein VIA61_08295 [Methylomirabilota bacterium]|jgi:hypothetical protein
MRPASVTRTRRIRLGVGLAASVMLAGCATAPIPPTYSQADLEAECERHGFWWHPDELTGGFCEHDSQM